MYCGEGALPDLDAKQSRRGSESEVTIEASAWK